MWKNSLKNVESDNNKILYETLLDFYGVNKPRMTETCSMLFNKDKKLLCLTEIYNLLSNITQRDEFHQMAKKCAATHYLRAGKVESSTCLRIKKLKKKPFRYCRFILELFKLEQKHQI